MVLDGQDHRIPAPRLVTVGFLFSFYLAVAGINIGSSDSDTHSDVTKACSLMVCSTSRNLILEVRVWP